MSKNGCYRRGDSTHFYSFFQVLQILKENTTMSLPEIPEQASTLLGENEQGVVCSRCSARSPEYFRYCFHCGLKLS